MRKRALTMTIMAVIFAVFLLGIPLGGLGTAYVWHTYQVQADRQGEQYGRTIDRFLGTGEDLDVNILNIWLGKNQDTAFLEVTFGNQKFRAGNEDLNNPFTTQIETPDGAKVLFRRSSADAVEMEIILASIMVTLSLLAIGAGSLIALHVSRRISAPLIYLAAQAEQLGSGSVRARVSPSGIEEIDLVQAELVRAGKRLAGRLAAERQFAADASHQLRTPLTALSMRLEEIEYLSDQSEVKAEASHCLDQLERLTGVIEDLLKTSRQAGGGTTQAINIDEFFGELEHEWHGLFQVNNRELVFINSTDRPALATPGSLSQVLSTIIENSLNYGDGKTVVDARMAPTNKGIFIEISDEGEGVDDEIAPDIFEKGVSGHGSTGIGLALAKTLIQSDGGRIELSQRRPAVFNVYVMAVPASLDPDKVLPQGALVTLSKRPRRF